MKTKTLFRIQSIIIIILLILLFRCCNENQDDCSNLDFETSPNKISEVMANEMEELYKSNQYPLINNEFGIIDLREHWFELEELKSFLCYIEQKGDSLSYDPNALGIRVYNAAKMDGADIKSSIFMVGTHNIVSDEIYNAKPGDPEPSMIVIEPNKNFTGISAFNYGNSGEPPEEFRHNGN